MPSVLTRARLEVERAEPPRLRRGLVRLERGLAEVAAQHQALRALIAQPRALEPRVRRAAARAPAAPPRRSRRAGWRGAGSARARRACRTARPGRRRRRPRSPPAAARSRAPDSKPSLAAAAAARSTVRPRHPRALGRVGHAVPQRQRVLELPQRLAGRVDALRLHARRHRRRERPRQVVRAVPVAGELGLRRRGVGLHRPRQRRVQRGPLAGQQVLVDRLADERVAERVRPVGVGDEQLVRDRLARAVDHVAGAATASSSAWPIGRSATAATRTTSWAAAGRRSKRPSSASRSVAGSSPESAEAASSSSV